MFLEHSSLKICFRIAFSTLETMKKDLQQNLWLNIDTIFLKIKSNFLLRTYKNQNLKNVTKTFWGETLKMKFPSIF